jgi:outer membrane protein OmpA-like peptidoglycan-associated protein
MQMTCKAIAISLLLVACAGNSPRPDLQNANTEYQSLVSDNTVANYAPVELQTAKRELDKANAYWQDGADKEILDHQIYTARNRIAFAKEKANIKYTDQLFEKVESDRAAILLQSRDQEIAELKNDLAELNAKNSDRGIVMTISNVLFAVDKASLLPGASRQLDKLATFLADHPDRKIQIEGFTDSSGTDAYNYDLSQRRAEAVAAALTMRGVDFHRIKVIGYGEAYPVASNTTSAGRQQNRRVEIIISNPGEDISPRG